MNTQRILNVIILLQCKAFVRKLTYAKIYINIAETVVMFWSEAYIFLLTFVWCFLDAVGRRIFQTEDDFQGWLPIVSTKM